MADGRQISYEVLVGDGNRWVTDSIHQSKTVATGRAQVLLADSQHKSVKVTREIGGAKPETVFQQEAGRRAEKPLTISPIAESSICAQADDLVTFEARKTTGRVLRKYLDRQNLTALELLHDYGHLRELRRTDRLFDQAIHRIASIQARSLDEAAPARIDLLYRLAIEVTDAARDADDTGALVTILNDEGLNAALGAIGSRPYFIHVVLAAYIGQNRDWHAKLGLVLDLLEKQPDAAALIHLDELCAEIMDGANSVRDILGAPRDIATALRLMIQLAIGQYAPAGHADPLLERFGLVMQRQILPVTRGILLERVARAMSGTTPLTRKSDAVDRAIFPTLLKMVVAPAELRGGVAMSQAVTRRARIAMKSGDDDLSPEDAIARILALLPNRAVAIGYLLDLLRSEFGEKYPAAVLTTLLDCLNSMNALTDLLPANSSPGDFTEAVSDLRRRIGDNAPGAEIHILVAKKLDSILIQNGGGAPEPANSVDIFPQPPKRRNGPRKRVYPPGEVIFQEGGPGDEAFMIVSGEIEISIRSGADRIVHAALGRGEIFGEMALIDDQPRMATATATRETMVLVVAQEVFKKCLDWLAEEDRLISHVMGILVTRLRQKGLDYTKVR